MDRAQMIEETVARELLASKELLRRAANTPVVGVDV